jgi:sugar lactone lactonase YvrE
MVLSGSDLFVETDGNSLGQPGGALWKLRGDGGEPQLIRDDAGRPRGLARLSDGRIVIADYEAHVVRTLDPSSNTLTTLAGQVGQPGMVNGSGTTARFNSPYDVVVLSDDSIIVSDYGNHCLRKVTTTGEVTTFAGQAGTSGQADGAVGTSRFNQPQGLALGPDGTIYVSDSGNFLIRKIAGGNVSTLAGDGSPGFSDATDPLSGELFGMEGLDVSPDGKYLYIADGNRGEDGPYNRVRRLTL